MDQFERQDSEMTLPNRVQGTSKNLSSSRFPMPSVKFPYKFSLTSICDGFRCGNAGKSGLFQDNPRFSKEGLTQVDKSGTNPSCPLSLFWEIKIQNPQIT